MRDNPRSSRRALTLTLLLVPGGDFLATSLARCCAALASIGDDINPTLLASDKHHAEIVRALVRPALLLWRAARDTFRRDRLGLETAHSPCQTPQ